MFMRHHKSANAHVIETIRTMEITNNPVASLIALGDLGLTGAQIKTMIGDDDTTEIIPEKFSKRQKRLLDEARFSAKLVLEVVPSYEAAYEVLAAPNLELHDRSIIDAFEDDSRGAMRAAYEFAMNRYNDDPSAITDLD